MNQAKAREAVVGGGRAGVMRRSRGLIRLGRVSSEGGLGDQAGEIGQEGEGIADEEGFGGVVQAEPGRAFESAVLLGGVAGFRIALAADAAFPGV